jgi:D-3-phosphoglycerate dehydrogenase / 2-oxoglutarate reductase
MAANRKKILIPSSMGKTGVDILRARDDIEVIPYPTDIAPSDLHKLLADAHGIALSVTPFKAAETAAAPELQVVARIGVGYDAVEIPPLTTRKIPLMVTGIANSTSVAEQAISFFFALAKRHAHLDKLVKDGNWGARYQHLPIELAGKTALVIGFGRIGTRSARRCKALDMHTLVYDPFVSQGMISGAGHEPVTDLDAAVARADFITIHAPKNAGTIGMFNAERLARTKKGAFIVNTARGGIIDEKALHAALTSGHIAGAGLDVFDMEPTPVNNTLLQLDSVLAAPHMAGVTAEAVAAMAEYTARNMLSVLDGETIRDNVVNKEVLD